MATVLKLVAVLSAGMFAGAAFYLTTVEHPAHMSTGVAPALQQFRPSNKRAAPQQGDWRSCALYRTPRLP
jgi:hypothetical protein